PASASSLPSPASSTSEPVLAVSDLHTRLRTPRGVLPVVNGVSFTLDAGRTLAVVGESGSGKTLLARSIMGLVPPALALPAPGRVQFDGQDLRTLKERELARRRGRDIAMVFQDPMTSLNPVLRVGEQITEVLRHHLRLSRDDA